VGETWLRVVTYRVDERAATEYVRDGVRDVLRMLTGRPGFRAGHWGADSDGRTLAAVTYWTDRACIAASGEELTALAVDRAAHGVRITAAANLRLLTCPTRWQPTDPGTAAEGAPPGWVRIVRYRPEPEAREDAADYLRSTTAVVFRVLRHQPGFRVGCWGHDPVDGTMGAVTYWDGPDAIAGASSLFERLHRERRSHGITTEHIANLELFPVPVRAESPP
jgi:hypothetical protein